MKKSLLRNSLITVAILAVSFSSSIPVAALDTMTPSSTPTKTDQYLQKTDQYFKDSNVQIMTIECDESTSSSAANTLMSSPSASTTSGGGGCGEKTDNSKINQDQVWSFFNNKFKEAGYTTEEAEAAAAGIGGNWRRESGFNPDKHNSAGKGSGCTGASGPVTGTVGLGIAQWCGSRQQNLADFAKEKGTDISCLGTQLEFTWMEMGERNLQTGMKGLSPSQAASVFNLGDKSKGVQGFEIGADNGIRMGHADDVYGEYTGKAPSTLGNTPTGTSSDTTACENKNNAVSSSAAAGGAPTSTGDCEIEKARFKKLVDAGKIDISNRKDGILDDVSKCTTAQIACGGVGGVNPRAIGVINDLAENVGKVYIWNFNNGHPDNHGGDDGNGCNRNHPHGKAVDIACGDGAVTDIELCKDFVDYILANKNKFGYTELIWQQKYLCDAGVNCNVNGHADHIHVGGSQW